MLDEDDRSEIHSDVDASTGARISLFRRLWSYFAQACGIAVIAIGVSFAMVYAFAHDGPVIRRVGEIDAPTLITQQLGTLNYTIDLERLESCPGDWVGVLESHTNLGAPAVVTIKRPSTQTQLKPSIVTGLRVSVQLPEAVFPGSWSYTSGVTSKCPTRTRYDELAHFEFQVRPQ